MNSCKTSIIKQPLSITAGWKAFKLFIPVYGFAIAFPIYLFWLFIILGFILIPNNSSAIGVFLIAFGLFIMTLLIIENIKILIPNLS